MSPRARDAAGRPVPPGSPGAVPGVPEHALPAEEALALARSLLADGRPFYAHDVLEAVWKAAPADERDLWQGLAQLCVGLTHLQRGNPVGAARLLRRGAGRLLDHAGASGADGAAPSPGGALRRECPALAQRARRLADRVEADPNLPGLAGSGAELLGPVR